MGRTAKKTWLEYQYLVHALRLVRQNAQIAKRIVELGLERYEDGRVLFYELLRAEGELPRLEFDQADLQERMQSVKAELEGLVGTKIHSRLSRAKLDYLKLDEGVEELVKAAFDENPEIIKARAELQVARRQLNQVQLSFYPDFGLSGVWMITGAEGAAPDRGKDAFGLAVSLNLPLWHSNLRNQVDSAKAMMRSAESKVLDVEQKVSAKIRALWHKIMSLERILKLYKYTLLPQAAIALRAAQEMREARGRLAVVMERRIILFKFRLGYLRALVDYYKSIADLEGVTGRPVKLIFPKLSTGSSQSTGAPNAPQVKKLKKGKTRR